MPIYCYRREDTGEPFQLAMTVAEMVKRQDGRGRIHLDGNVSALRDYAAERGAMIPERQNTWPMYSDAAGVHPDQIPQAMQVARERGVATDFTADGRAIFTSAKHRKDYCELYGLYDRNGGYSDPQRKGGRR